ncbi:MAG: hypothetical protein K2Y32_17055 [Candidatus Obscuribacterales bacterium]|nr:hypothetical protein [Candidatus Obscuribacterales bacterium]
MTKPQTTLILPENELAETGEPNDKGCPTLSEIAELLKQGSEHQRWQELDKAEGFYADAVSMARQKLGAKHQVLGYALADLAQLQESKGDEINARHNFVEALHILEPQLGNNHPVTLDIFGRLHHLFRL